MEACIRGHSRLELTRRIINGNLDQINKLYPFFFRLNYLGSKFPFGRHKSDNSGKSFIRKSVDFYIRTRTRPDFTDLSFRDVYFQIDTRQIGDGDNFILGLFCG